MCYDMTSYLNVPYRIINLQRKKLLRNNFFFNKKKQGKSVLKPKTASILFLFLHHPIGDLVSLLVNTDCSSIFNAVC